MILLLGSALIIGTTSSMPYDTLIENFNVKNYDECGWKYSKLIVFEICTYYKKYISTITLHSPYTYIYIHNCKVTQ